MENLTLKNQFAVIAGASQGIGAEIAKLFSAEGAKVILLARNEQNLQQVAAEIENSGGKSYSYPMDVSISANWRKLSEWMKLQNFSCDILINNTYWWKLVPIGDLSDEDWQQTIDVSLKAYFLGSREMIPFMLERGRGSIVNISSLQSHIPESSFGAYAVAKGGVEALSRVIAKDYCPTIRANTIVCGAVDTPGFAEGEDFKKKLGSLLPVGRIGYASEIANSALFLASTHSSFITGTELIVDGGRTIT